MRQRDRCAGLSRNFATSFAAPRVRPCPSPRLFGLLFFGFRRRRCGECRQLFHKLFLLTLGQLAHQLDDLTKSIRLGDQGTEGHTKCIGQIQGSLEIWDMRARFVAADASLSDATLQSKSDTQVLLHKANC
ncbi:hypothetical protein CFBP2044_15590 [Xanthomonas hortorum pv. cynarae]|nr:hypothetical protein CFBP2044_15590 [Xanthomonas hortorum pv. cynarae]CAD0320078.1 hypothetical protein CFBP2044_15590 [Xanthomonas hortorum pv. cynarae]